MSTQSFLLLAGVVSVGAWLLFTSPTQAKSHAWFDDRGYFDNRGFDYNDYFDDSGYDYGNYFDDRSFDDYGYGYSGYFDDSYYKNYHYPFFSASNRFSNNFIEIDYERFMFISNNRFHNPWSFRKSYYPRYDYGRYYPHYQYASYGW